MAHLLLVNILYGANAPFFKWVNSNVTQSLKNLNVTVWYNALYRDIIRDTSSVTGISDNVKQYYNKMPNGINRRDFLGQLWPWRICLYWYSTYVKVDLEWWPWHVTPKHVWLNEMHVHAKYYVYVATMTEFKLTLKDDLDLDMLPLYMCVSFRYTSLLDTHACKIYGFYLK